MKKIYYYILTVFIYTATISGCATSPYPTTPVQSFGMPGIYHRVEKGQTLWKISQIYQTDLDTLASINRILDATKIEENQLIFIPGQKKEITAALKDSSDDFIWPLRGKVIASFGQAFGNMVNKGINIQPYQNQDVVAARSGKVTFSSENFGPFGKTIIIEHGDGFSTVYARNSRLLVKAGDGVQRGTSIAKVGASGRDKAAYLHFEVRKGHLSQNPVFYLP
ncbi:MAG: peptidoglycan DD-metalloendopeptidase family protein [Candidatus Omnitrophica bacterium]|nr:peptidoglycan DD-metalloendopeptidase family protein [Candidatus Omnitrophota bacterium]